MKMAETENTVGKGEIARYKQFLLFPQCFEFKRLVLQTRENQTGLVWERVKQDFALNLSPGSVFR